MQRLVTSKVMTTIALTAGAAALGVFGSSAAIASPAPAGTVTPAAARTAHVDGQVVSNLPLRIRALATTDSASLGNYAPGAIVHISCKVNGQNVDGNPRWYKLSDRSGWLAARYVVNLGVVPWC